MATGRRGLGAALGVLIGLAAASCQGTAPPAGRPASLESVPAADPRTDAYLRLRSRLDVFHVSGAVKTSEGLLLPENIRIEIRSEVCVESREPGARFWSLDYDTCFAFVAVDTVSAVGEYSVSVPCLDADTEYESRHAFGDLRLVQRGPVAFLAESDAGWKHQETFTSSRTQRRDLLLTLEPETFWVVRGGAEFRTRPHPDAALVREYDFGTGVGVIRFHNGWAQIVMDERIGWMEMRFLGTEAELKAAAPFEGKAVVEPLRVGTDP